MRRLTRGSRILYVERHRGGSALFFLAALLGMAIAGAAWEKGDAPATALMAAVSLGFAVYAMTRLLKSRLLVIDRDQDLLSLITREPFRRKRETFASIRGLSLLVDGRLVVSQYIGKGGGEKRLLYQDLWIVLKSGERWLFDRDFLAPAGMHLALRLAQDLECEVVKGERQVW